MGYDYRNNDIKKMVLKTNHDIPQSRKAKNEELFCSYWLHNDLKKLVETDP